MFLGSTNFVILNERPPRKRTPLKAHPLEWAPHRMIAPIRIGFLNERPGHSFE